MWLLLKGIRQLWKGRLWEELLRFDALPWLRSIIRASAAVNLPRRSDPFPDIGSGLRWCRARVAFVPSAVPAQAQPRGQTPSLRQRGCSRAQHGCSAGRGESNHPKENIM